MQDKCLANTKQVGNQWGASGEQAQRNAAQEPPKGRTLAMEILYKCKQAVSTSLQRNSIEIKIQERCLLTFTITFQKQVIYLNTKTKD